MMKKLALLLSLVFGLTGCGAAFSMAGAEASKQPVAVLTGEELLTVHFIDVGQADCALLASDGHYMVIDGGNNDDAETIVDYLQGQGVQTLDAVVGTHPHEDHIGSLDAVINSFDVEKVYMPKIMHTSQTFEDVLDAIANKGLKITAPKPGDTFSFGACQVEVMGPWQEYSDFNNNSIVLRVTAGETRFLFTGDAEKTAEEDMMRNGCDLQADVLKVGHHGSSTSTSDGFLQAVSPSCAVISAGEGNSYGHPEQATLEKLEDYGVNIYRTDEQGTIVCTTDGVDITCYFANGAENGERQEPKSDLAAEPAEAAEIYIGNKKSMKFHSEKCASLPEEQNRVYLKSREEAVELGYTPCGSCQP